MRGAPDCILTAKPSSGARLNPSPEVGSQKSTKSTKPEQGGRNKDRVIRYHAAGCGNVCLFVGFCEIYFSFRV